MEPYGGPAALGGVITGLMLGAWMLGRWQNRLSDTGSPAMAEAASTPHVEAPDLRPCQQAARAERHDVAEGFASLGELHADVSAYREAQQVLATGAMIGAIGVGWSASGDAAACRYMGVIGQPTCSSVGLTGSVCACAGSGLQLPRPLPPVPQPSAEPVAFTRV